METLEENSEYLCWAPSGPSLEMVLHFLPFPTAPSSAHTSQPCGTEPMWPWFLYFRICLTPPHCWISKCASYSSEHIQCLARSSYAISSKWMNDAPWPASPQTCTPACLPPGGMAARRRRQIDLLGSRQGVDFGVGLIWGDYGYELCHPVQLLYSLFSIRCFEYYGVRNSP